MNFLKTPYIEMLTQLFIICTYFICLTSSSVILQHSSSILAKLISLNILPYSFLAVNLFLCCFSFLGCPDISPHSDSVHLAHLCHKDFAAVPGPSSLFLSAVLGHFFSSGWYLIKRRQFTAGNVLCSDTAFFCQLLNA